MNPKPVPSKNITNDDSFIQSVLNATPSQYITSDDIKKILKNFNIPPSKVLIKKILSELDLNKDGQVTKTEFITYKHKKDLEVKQVFESIDINRNGYLEIHEISKALDLLHMKVSPEQIEDLVDKMDRSNDNLISLEEFTNFILLLPGNNISCLFDSWMKTTSIDIGESSFTLPDELKKTNQKEIFIIFCSGGIAGTFSRTLTAPLDRLKVIWQASRGTHEASIVQGLKSIYNHDGGFVAFFKGNGTNVLKIAPETGAKSLTYDRIKKVICKNAKKPTKVERFIGGGIAGALAHSLVYPLELVKTRLNIAPAGYYKGIMHCFYKIVKKEGVLQLYKGMGASLLGIIPYAAVDLAIYSNLKDFYMEKYESLPSVWILLSCGAFSSIWGQTISYPLTLIRTKLQSQGIQQENKEFDGIRDCVKKIYKAEGVTGFYKGFTPNLLKSVPAVAISYTIFENCKAILMKKFNKKN